MTDSDPSIANDSRSDGTPGPWRHAGHGHIWATDTTSRHDTSVTRVAVVGAFHDAELLPFNRGRWAADARLMAAAPDLLEALTEIASLASGATCAIGHKSKQRFISLIAAAADRALAAAQAPERPQS